MMVGETLLQRNSRVFGCEHPVAFVTGSLTPRVGRSIAELLTDQGFLMVYHGRSHGRPSSQATPVEAGDFPTQTPEGDSLTLYGEVQEERVVESWYQEILRRHERIDLVVNSAAIWEPKKLEETTSEDFLQFFRVNTLGTALVCKHFGLAMVAQSHGGCIVNIGDWAVARPYPDFAAYFASKGSIDTLTRSMAVELASKNSNIRVNAVMPGPVLLADEIDIERQKTIVAESLLQRAGTANDVAHAVLFLATSPFVTGACLPVDGGRSVFAGNNKDAIAHPNVE